jgi:hypothetical protein
MMRINGVFLIAFLWREVPEPDATLRIALNPFVVSSPIAANRPEYHEALEPTNHIPPA